MSSERPFSKIGLATAIGCLCLLCCGLSLRAESPTDKPAQAVDEPAKADAPVSVATARDRARLMHTIYASTLEVMHHHYFHSNKSIVPARAMEDIFADLARQSKTTARWIAVSTKAMSLDHEPASEFEKHAATEIKGGKSSVERIEAGYYRRAGAIPLDSGCVSCHTGGFAPPSGLPKFAALVISVPVTEK